MLHHPRHVARLLRAVAIAATATGCASPLPAPTDLQRAVMQSITEPVCRITERGERVSLAFGTITFLDEDLILTTRHLDDGAEEGRTAVVDREGPAAWRVLTAGEGERPSMRPDLHLPGSSLATVARDWQLGRLERPADAARRVLPARAEAAMVGARVLLAGWHPVGTAGDRLALDRDPARWRFPPGQEFAFWCTVGEIVRVDASGAFEVRCGDLDVGDGGCSGGAVVLLDDAGAPTATIGIFAATLVAPALPELIRSLAACAPIERGVAAISAEELAARSTTPSTRPVR